MNGSASFARQSLSSTVRATPAGGVLRLISIEGWLRVDGTMRRGRVPWILDLGYIQLKSLFLRTFGLKTMDHLQKSLTRQCYRGALPVRDKLARHSQGHTLTCPSCGLERETVQHAIVQFSGRGVVDMWAYDEHLLSGLGRVQISAESILKIDPPSFFSSEGKNCLLMVVAVSW